MGLNKDVRKASKQMDGQVGYEWDEYYKANKQGKKNLGMAWQAGLAGAGTGAKVGGVPGAALGLGIGLVAGGTKGMRQSKKDYLDYVENLNKPEVVEPVITNSKPFLMEDDTMTTSTENLYSYRMKNGGLNAAKVTINVEKGELLVDAKTGEILEDYMDKPKHPKGENNVDLRGFTTVKEGTVVIPAKYRGKYMSKDADRLSIIKEVIANADNNVKAENGTNLMVGPTDYNWNQPVSQDIDYGQVGNAYAYNIPSQNYAMNYQAPAPASTQTTSGGSNSTSWMAGIPQTALGLWQAQQSMKGLKALDKQPLTMYNEQVQPELARAQYRGTLAAELANKRARTGLSADEMGAYKGQVAQASNLAYQRGLSQAGGNLGQAIRSTINANNVMALNQLAIQDAQLKARKQAEAERLAQYVDNIGARIAAQRASQQNANAQYLQRRRELLERAYGAGMTQGTQNVASGTSSMLAGLAQGAAAATKVAGV